MKLFKTEPVLTIGGIAAAVVALLAIFGIVVETRLVETLLIVAVPLIVAALARRHVTPNVKVAPVVVPESGHTTVGVTKSKPGKKTT